MSEQDSRTEIARIPVRRIMRPLLAGFATPSVRARGQVVNLSHFGMFIASDALPESGESIKLAFEDGSGMKLEVQGTVRWTTADDDEVSGFGLRIHQPPEAYTEFCDALLEALGTESLSD